MNLERLLVASERRLFLAHVEVDLSNGVQENRFTGGVVRRLHESAGFDETIESLLVLAEARVELSKSAHRPRLQGGLTGVSRQRRHALEGRSGLLVPIERHRREPDVKERSGLQTGGGDAGGDRCSALEGSKRLSRPSHRGLRGAEIQERFESLGRRAGTQRGLKRRLGESVSDVELSRSLTNRREVVRSASDELLAPRCSRERERCLVLGESGVEVS